ncbi:hypothetical protein M8C21_021560 [Ambrosia artemisiifolia]|uniref:Protein kinase domain-containing protein n=1 Tax=Ambrosia artemisiifolia TaxID=4212 RepID=A0AAD5DC92_AMBAR|nr:hypothetical protein M8C21_021560 [Ambrosia artemisiifolia]
MSQKTDLVVVGVCVGVAVGIFLASLVFFGVRWYKRRARLRRFANDRGTSTRPIRENGVNTSNALSESFSNSLTVNVSTYPAKTSPLYKWKKNRNEPVVSASDYQDTLTIYKATMPGGEVIAVKALAANSKQGDKEFQTEVSLLGRLHHRNLVNLVGYCVDKGQRMLIYEYMSNGSLASEEKDSLNWQQRLQIALDISHGIEYLHDGAVPPVIHRDLKSANVLLDHLMRAKAAMNSDGIDEILDKELVGDCDPEDVRSLARIAHRCLHKTPRKRPLIGEVSQAITKLKQRRLVREDSTIAFAGEEFSGVVGCIELQENQLKKMTSIAES